MTPFQAFGSFRSPCSDEHYGNTNDCSADISANSGAGTPEIPDFYQYHPDGWNDGYNTAKVYDPFCDTHFCLS